MLQGIVTGVVFLQMVQHDAAFEVGGYEVGGGRKTLGKAAIVALGLCLVSQRDTETAEGEQGLVGQRTGRIASHKCPERVLRCNLLPLGAECFRCEKCLLLFLRCLGNARGKARRCGRGRGCAAPEQHRQGKAPEEEGPSDTLHDGPWMDTACAQRTTGDTRA